MKPTLCILESPITLIVIRILTVLYLLDAENLNDLIPGVIVPHPDANQMTIDRKDYGRETGCATADVLVFSFSWQTDCQHITILADVDSPSLAAQSDNTTGSMSRSPKSLPSADPRERSHCSLCIFNHSLLI
jgi:hypothetical protein